MATTYGSWTGWKPFKQNDAQGTVTYRSVRAVWNDGKPGGFEERYKTENLTRPAGTPGGVPSQPSASTPVKTSPTSEYVAPKQESVWNVIEAPRTPEQGYSISSERVPGGMVITETVPVREESPVKAIPPIEKQNFKLPGEDIVRSFWYGDQAKIGPLIQPMPEVKVKYGPSSRAILAESFVGISSGLAVGSVFRVAMPAAETASGFLKTIYQGSKVVMGGSIATQIGVDVGTTAAYGTTSTELSRKVLGYGTSFAAAGLTGGAFDRFLNKTYNAPSMIYTTDKIYYGVSKNPDIEIMKQILKQPVMRESIIGFQGKTLTQKISGIKSYFFEPVQLSTKFLGMSERRLSYGKTTYQDISYWRQMNKIPSEYEGVQLSKFAPIDTRWGTDTVNIYGKPPTLGYSYDISSGYKGEILTSIQPIRQASAIEYHKPVDMKYTYSLDVKPNTGETIPGIRPYKESIDFKIPKTTEPKYSYSIDINKGEIIQGIKPYRQSNILKAPGTITGDLGDIKFNIGDAGYTAMLRSTLKFSKTTWPTTYQSMDFYKMPSESIPKTTSIKTVEPVKAAGYGNIIFYPPTYQKVSLRKLEDMEYGLGVSSYWAASKPSMISSSKLDVSSSFKNISSEKLSTDVKTSYDNIPLLKVNQMSYQISDQIQNMLNDSTQNVRTDTIQQQAQMQQQETMQLQKTLLKTKQFQIQKQRFDDITDIDYDMYDGAETKKVKPGVPWLPSFPSGKDKDEGLMAGYDVFVKARRYYKGKKRKPESWTKINPHPLTREQALSLGGSAVEHSAAASFKLRAASGAAKPLDIKVESWGGLAGKFYEKKGVLIERTLHRINTGGEIKGISALGWIAERRKAYPSVQPVRLKDTQFKQITASKMVDVNKMVDIRRVMRGWRL